MSDHTDRVAIVGAGITGLTLAYRLADGPGPEPVVFEASDAPGGRIRSARHDGYLLEAGPHTIVERSTAMADLIDDLGLREAAVETDDAADKRFIVKDGELHPAPMSGSGFLSTPLFDASSKIGLLAEPLVPPRRDDVDESLANFVRRRLGEDILDYAVDPFVGGVFAGQPRLLSARHAFEQLVEYEEEHGSLAGGLLASLFDAKDEDDDVERKLLSFECGSRQLPDRLADRLGDRIEYSAEVRGLRRSDGEWELSLETDGGRELAGPFGDAVWTAPTYELAQIELAGDVGTADLSELPAVEYPPVTIVATGFHRTQVGHPLDGFGCLVPSSEPYRILGSLFMSSLFPERAPRGHVLLSNFVGGSRAPHLPSEPEDRLVEMVLTDLRELLDISGEPTMTYTFEWPRAIPQYEVGYDRFLVELERLEDRFPGLHFAGSFRNGVAVPDLVDAGSTLADELV